MVEHSAGNYKVFTYGFPFEINDCNVLLDGLVYPSPLQTPYRIAGNFLFFFFLSFFAMRFIIWLWNRRRANRLPADRMEAISQI